MTGNSLPFNLHLLKFSMLRISVVKTRKILKIAPFHSKKNFFFFKYKYSLYFLSLNETHLQFKNAWERKKNGQLRCVQTTDSTHYHSVRFDLENR